MSGIGEKFKTFWHHVAPLLLILFFMILEVIPYNIAGYTGIKPELILIAIFYWSVHKPSLMSPLLSFLLGLTLDMISALPLGVNALTFVLINKLATDQRRVFLGQPYWVSWAGFSIVALLAICVQTALVYLITGALAEYSNLLMIFILTVALFPLISFLLIASHKIMLRSKQGNI